MGENSITNDNKNDNLKPYFLDAIISSWKQILKYIKLLEKRRRVLTYEELNRYINSTFKRNLRKIRKDCESREIDISHWNKFDPHIAKYMDYLKNNLKKIFNSESSQLIDKFYQLWGGLPRFDVYNGDTDEPIYYFLVLNPIGTKEIRSIGIVDLISNKKSSASEKHITDLKKIMKIIYSDYKQIPEYQLIHYISPYHIPNFKFEFGSDDLFDKPKEKNELEENQSGKILIQKPEPERIENIEEIEVGEETNELEGNEFNRSNNTADKVPATNPKSKAYEWVGKVIQSKTKPMSQGKGTRRIEEIIVEGWLYPNFCNLAQHNRYFIAQHQDLNTINDDKVPQEHRRRVLIKINDYKDWSEDTAHEISDEAHLSHRTQCWFDFEKYLDPDSYGSYKPIPIAGTGMDKYKIRDLTQEEYNVVYDLFPKGIPFGLFIHDDDTTIDDYPKVKIPFNFPVSEAQYEQLFYTPMFLVGRPSAGKTNALKALCAASINSDQFLDNRLPSFIFFDYEGQFQLLADPVNFEDIESKDKNIYDTLNMEPIDHNNVVILGNNAENGLSISFSFKELLDGLNINKMIDYIKYFLRNLSDITESAFNKIAKDVLTRISPNTYYDFKIEFLNDLNNPNNPTANILTKSQRQAIMRTLSGEIENFFDQKGSKFNLSHLIKPGKVIIFDLKEIPREKAILYVLLMLYKLKVEQKNIIDESIIAVIDEAHEVFKNASGSSASKRFYNLISKFLGKFGSRGRKYRLGLWLASQRPQDLHKDIQKNIGTYMILGLNPEHEKWLRSALGKTSDANFVLEMPNHYAMFKNTSLFRGKSHLIRLIKSPNIHKTFV